MSICLDKRHAKLWCSEPIENIENRLKLSRKEVEMLDKENKLMEVLHD